jgi:hypothetical protein
VITRRSIDLGLLLIGSDHNSYLKRTEFVDDKINKVSKELLSAGIVKYEMILVIQSRMNNEWFKSEED